MKGNWITLVVGLAVSAFLVVGPAWAESVRQATDKDNDKVSADKVQKKAAGSIPGKEGTGKAKDGIVPYTRPTKAPPKISDPAPKPPVTSSKPASKPTTTSSVPVSKPPATSSKPTPTPSKPTSPDKFTKEKEYAQNHKNRVVKIEDDYNKKIGRNQQQIKDLQQQSSASGSGVKETHEKKIDKLNQDIKKLNDDKKQKIDDSRDLNKRQKDSLWNR